MLIAYTCGGQKSERKACKLVAYTCGGQKSKRNPHMLIAYNCGGQKSGIGALMLHAVSYSLKFTPKSCSQAPAVGKCLKVQSSTLPSNTIEVSRCLWPPPRCLSIIKILHICKNAQIFTFLSKLCGPLVADQKSGLDTPSGLSQRSFLPSFIQIRQN